MKRSMLAVWLSSLIAVLALVAAGAGLLWQDGGGPFSFTSVRGQTVQIAGQGLYRFDSLQKSAILRGTDAATLLVCIPLLLLSIALYHRRSLKGSVLLTGVLAYFCYNSASLAFGAAYNSLFLVYIALFSASCFALALAFGSIPIATLPAHISPRLPRRAIAVFLFVAALVLLLVWLGDIVGALVRGQALPGLHAYTTEVTYVLDLGLVVPTALVAGVLLLRRAALGYLLAALMLVLNAIIGVVVVAQTAVMALAGLTLSVGQLAAYVGSFVALALIATWLAALLFRSISESGRGQAAYV